MPFTDKKLHYTLRFASAMCFIGHGAFGIITKQIWCNYFAVFGISNAMAYHLMPVIGTIDILMGISLLIYPTRAVLLWLIIWGTFTALLRPASGESLAEFAERAGNYGVPLVLLILCSSSNQNNKAWFAPIDENRLYDGQTHIKASDCLKMIVFLLVIGHGWLNLAAKPGLLQQYVSLGFSNPVQTAHLTGIFELIAACSILIRPVRSIVLFLFIWKMGSELFYPHWEMFEWIERGGSYGAILSLWFILPHVSRSPSLLYGHKHS
jgi:hypothetical protein